MRRASVFCPRRQWLRRALRRRARGGDPTITARHPIVRASLSLPATASAPASVRGREARESPCGRVGWLRPREWRRPRDRASPSERLNRPATSCLYRRRAELARQQPITHGWRATSLDVPQHCQSRLKTAWVLAKVLCQLAGSGRRPLRHNGNVMRFAARVARLARPLRPPRRSVRPRDERHLSSGRQRNDEREIARRAPHRLDDKRAMV